MFVSLSPEEVSKLESQGLMFKKLNRLNIVTDKELQDEIDAFQVKSAFEAMAEQLSELSAEEDAGRLDDD